ncbi:type IV pilus biogenesis/stability protein PilW [Sediminicurvatus halobius]|uniref:Type IV pilus biogenesis/stability protein PilW n=1 Tax=Sediminicurvatus halobius TaxID=2182432 RepID=A0A2U2N4U4_9GAMM|nr:type IV pilus biogenesis/stability protein PilW [Spiribacter halobius]PWG64058.1 type IV pilus biogenesis/stability protein PilW [Spiribacter halobius]UEX76887.1 type IV pilus biogenesis/stability protein PilW [Spiribacter halobius]
MRRLAPLVLVLLALLAGCATTGNPTMTSEQAARASEANTQLAIRYLQQGNLQEALRKAQKAVEQDGDSSPAHMVTAEIYNQLDEADQARRYYQQAVRLDPENGAALNNFGRFLCARGERERAQELFERAADNPLYERPEVPLTNAGRCALQDGQKAEAEDYFRAALQRNPRFPTALLNLAALRLDDGDSLSARAFYERYLDAVNRQTPESLWVGIRLAAATDDRDRLASYSLLLRQRYPESEEAARLLEWERNGRL